MSELTTTSISTSTPTKQVRWKRVVEEYSVLDTTESRTVALQGSRPSPPGTFEMFPTASTSPNRALPYPSRWTPFSPPSHSLPLPPAPRPMDGLPLPPAIQLHTVLTPAHALQLDFSSPSTAFRCNTQLTPILLSAAACTPPQTTLVVRISFGPGLYSAKIQVRHASGGGVTLGDVLTTIHMYLRQPDNEPPHEAEAYTTRRILTVNAFCDGRSAETQAVHIAAEREGGPKIIDRLLGHTLFAGLTPLLGKPRNYLQLELGVPPRYERLQYTA